MKMDDLLTLPTAAQKLSQNIPDKSAVIMHEWFEAGVGVVVTGNAEPCVDVLPAQSSAVSRDVLLVTSAPDRPRPTAQAHVSQKVWSD